MGATRYQVPNILDKISDVGGRIGAKTFSITTLGIITLGIITLSIVGLIVTLAK